ncbi:MAG TPA: hypothetical protein VH157_13535 [Bryobacteraceae bacterium]|jgi:hypothetical protein|nr:hypothetical protein [Bryobacteraceae bacterium]
MDKRLQKRHKRQVARAKEHVKLSEPDLRTPEQVTAAREAARSAIGRRNANDAQFAAPSVGKHPAGPAPHSAAKTDV